MSEAPGLDLVEVTPPQTKLGGDEVVIILERVKGAAPQPFEYHLVATSKTSTLQKEVQEAGAAGYDVVGMTVSETAFGGKEIVAITRRDRAP